MYYPRPNGTVPRYDINSSEVSVLHSFVLRRPAYTALTLVVYHHGRHATGGHYTVDVLRQDHSEWIRIDDTNIEPVREDEVVTINAEGLRNSQAAGVQINPSTGVPDKVAYLLFYKRIL